MEACDPLADAFERIRNGVRGVVEDLSPEQVAFRPAGKGNSIAWLVWHLTRVQDDHVADLIPAEQLWMTEGWAGRWGLPLDPSDTGYGHHSDQVDQVRVDQVELLTRYHDAVAERTIRYVSQLEVRDLDRIVDERWDPPVSLGVRLVSVMEDDFQHLGQAAYVRGLLPQS